MKRKVSEAANGEGARLVVLRNADAPGAANASETERRRMREWLDTTLFAKEPGRALGEAGLNLRDALLALPTSRQAPLGVLVPTWGERVSVKEPFNANGLVPNGSRRDFVFA